MQHGPTETLQNLQTRSNPDLSNTSHQHGFFHHDPSGSALALDPRQQQARLGSLSPQSARIGATSGSFTEGVDSESLEERLRGLNHSASLDAGSPPLPGKRISEYENALAPSTPRKALGFKVIRRDDALASGVLLSEFPNGMS